MTPEETAKPKRIRKPKEAVKHLCHVHIECDVNDRKDINKSVCRDLETIEHTDGKHYCLLHLPTKEKDIEKFKQVFEERLHEHDDTIVKIEAKFPDDKDKQYEAIMEQKIDYDFRYVCFPSKVDLIEHNFKALADFSSATFSGNADFSSTTFGGFTNFSSAIFSSSTTFWGAVFKSEADFNMTMFTGEAQFYGVTFTSDADYSLATFAFDSGFIKTIFLASADFSGTIFTRETYFLDSNFTSSADFSSATFSNDADFNSVKFFSNANFSSATFNGNADFSSAIFNGEVEFNKTKFGQSGETKFFKAKFEKDTIFEETEFNNPVSFNSAVFGKESDIIFRDAFFAQYASFRYSTSEGYLRFINLRQSEENRFNFEEASFEKASRISFHTLRLRPNWFINIDSRKFVFTNIDWENIEIKNGIKNIKAEIKQLETRKTPEPARLLEISCGQLAVNAEQNNRYEEASRLRYMAMETKRLDESITTRFVFWLYKWTSCYGESWSWALGILVCILLVFAFLFTTRLASFDYGKERPVKTFHGYTDVFADNLEIIKTTICGNVDDSAPFRPMNRCEAVSHSLAVASFQRPEPKSEGFFTKLLTTLETIFAPLQAALLALAIRRKFMR